MAWKVTAGVEIGVMSETFTHLFFALRATKVALKKGAKVTIEKIEL